MLAALLSWGYQVRALVRPGSTPPPERDGCQVISGDVTRSGELVPHLAGCRYLIHVAALYSFSPSSRASARATNVQGTRSILEAARLAGIERAVVTSSSATVGPARHGRPATEADYAVEEHRASPYHQSKVEQERVALAAQLPVILVLPTMPVGPGDWKPTPTGKMVLDFMRGRIFATLGGGLNVVPVEDVARAHVMALRQGRPGERYLVGGENLALAEVWTLLAGICRRPAPVRVIPYSLALALGWADEVRCRITGQQPVVPLEGVHMARHNMFVRCDKAEAELGYSTTPVSGALLRAVNWYRNNGYA